MITHSRSSPALPRDALRLWTGLIAIAAPILHSATDLMELTSDGFTHVQLWINFAAFLPMPLLLPGICAALDPRPGRLCFAGALLYGAAFVYFMYTTIYAIQNDIPDYATLLHDLGFPYTVAGGLMVVGGLLFAIGALRRSPLPRIAVWMFLLGIATNLVIAIIPAPDILQTAGSGIRNAGLVLMGLYILNERTRAKA